MNGSKIEVDYLIVGSGAMGMAFTDTLLTETGASVAMVDRNAALGGHWNIAYPHVRLHQPSAFYGVNSANLGNDTIDQIGWNKGLYELASGNEVCAYFEQVMLGDIWDLWCRVSFSHGAAPSGLNPRWCRH